MKSYILSIDQGTTGSRAFIFNQTGQVVGSAYQEFKQYYPKPGWVEHDPEEIWESVVATIKKAIKAAKIESTAIKAIGITNQRETTVVWDRSTGKPVYRAIVWQCRRTAARCEALKKYQPKVRQITGLVVDAYFSATKIEWILAHVKGAQQKAKAGKLACGTIDTWLLWKLTGGSAHGTDYTNASRTMLFDINKKEWSTTLLNLFEVPEQMLPNVQASGSIFGYTTAVAGLPKDIPISSMMGDQQAALYGQHCTDVGMMKNTYGTGCFLLLNTGNKRISSTKGLLTTLACDSVGNPTYALEGAVFIGGAVIQWLRDELKMIVRASDTEASIAGINDTQGVYIVPAFVGLGAPYWQPLAKGAIVGLTRGSNRQHIIRAALESIAYQSRDIADLMKKESGLSIKMLAVDGGACRNNFLMQFQTDLLQAKIVRPKNVDSTAAGAAYLAGIVTGIWKAKDILKMHHIERTFKPQMSIASSNQKYEGWQKAVARVL